MSFSKIRAPTNDKKLINSGKVTTLNPNAAEFIPFALRSSSESTSTAEASTNLGVAGVGTLGKAVLDRSGSSISNNSDEEAHQYWRRQLPDDITPDFKVMGEAESQGINGIPFSMLSLHDGNETSRFSASTGSGFVLKGQHELPSRGINGNIVTEKMRYSVPSYGEDVSSTNFLHLPTKPWDKSIVDNDQLLSTVRDGLPYSGNSRQGLLNEQAITENTEMNFLEFLAMQFPDFAAESLAEVYFANGGDLNLTIEMLTRLELQVDGGLNLNQNQNLNPKALSAPNLSALDFPALSVQDGQNGLPKYAGNEMGKSVSSYQSASNDNMVLFKSSSSIPPRGAIDFASAVRKMSSHDSNTWKYERNGSADASVGSSRSVHVLASSYNGGQGRGIYGDKLQSRSSSLAAPVWIETGEAVANIFSELREEARDHARLRNAYFAQARQAYLIGNKALAKELCVKGQLHNMHMKAAHGKAQESIYRQRNPVSPEMQGNVRGQERIIDLHGLHVSEAIQVLKRDLTVLRSTARSVEQRLPVYICVGTGHHTKGSRTPARLPIAVQRYLLEEGIEYAEPQPGLLRIVLY
ncbi:polyadenylate-binding protein-interacting protein 7-like isoform X2 [Actinidia eriantha]|uniref:polyadenylate-binding protein-interacting protein 7-like isoform X2 n=1 Tax=Actinidia eriantha TaxID=165200 RepID=UPI00258D841A|nr:polyadenylate-binding protein-interacting protein 7-like isoform X2 [Actinidia eriantha]